MTTKFLIIKFARFPNFIVMEFPRKKKKNCVLGQFSVNFPLPNPLQNANFINIVVSASMISKRYFGQFKGYILCSGNVGGFFLLLPRVEVATGALQSF